MTTHDEARDIVDDAEQDGEGNFLEYATTAKLREYIDANEQAEAAALKHLDEWSKKDLAIRAELSEKLQAATERAETAERELESARETNRSLNDRLYEALKEAGEAAADEAFAAQSLAAAVERAETAERENERLRAALEAVRSVLIAENDARPALVISGIVDQFDRGATAEELAVQRENWARGELELAKDPTP